MLFQCCYVSFNKVYSPVCGATASPVDIIYFTHMCKRLQWLHRITKRLGPIKLVKNSTCYWSACNKPGKRAVMYTCVWKRAVMCVSIPPSFYDVSIGFSYCSDNRVFLSFFVSDNHFGIIKLFLVITTPLSLENEEITRSDYVLAAYDDICYKTVHIDFMATSGKLIKTFPYSSWPNKYDRVWI
jgi:hypothetical protein